MAQIDSTAFETIKGENHMWPTTVVQINSQTVVKTKTYNTNFIAQPCPPVVVSGVALGLPNALDSEYRVFDSRNVDRLFKGENTISSISEEEKQDLLSMQVKKQAPAGPKTKADTIHIVGRMGSFDLVEEYKVPKYMAEAMDITNQMALAAGIEALRNAGIKLGSCDGKHSAFMLPPDMREDTGIVFASAFPSFEAAVKEVSRRTEWQCNNRSAEGADDAMYPFDRKLLFKLMVLANSQLAELIGAQGPNTQLSAACSSTSQGVAVAEDWIKCGRCRRVLVIGADAPTQPSTLPYIGAGFMSLGAATTAETVEEGALPFDRRRNGMILGAGAVGLLLEASSFQPGLRAPPAAPKAVLVGSHFFNTAYHASSLDGKLIGKELNKFITRMEPVLGISRHELARDLLYFSHDTFTNHNGGCAQVEVDALSTAFGDESRSEILLCNIKGFTGHAMGCCLEDAVAVLALQENRVPPIANFKVSDPALGNINLSKGGPHNRHYSLRFSSGFGSQVVFLLFASVNRT